MVIMALSEPFSAHSDVSPVRADACCCEAGTLVGPRDEPLRFLVNVVEDYIAATWIHHGLFIHIADVAANIPLEAKYMAGLGDCYGHVYGLCLSPSCY